MRMSPDAPDSLLKASEMRATQQPETVNGVAKYVS